MRILWPEKNDSPGGVCINHYLSLLGINKKSFALATHTGKVVVCQAQLLFVWQAHSTGAAKSFPAHQTS